MSWSRFLTWPGRCASAFKIRNSVTVRLMRPPFQVQRWRAGSSVNSPRTSGASATSPGRSEEHTSELQSLMRISYAVFCLKKKNKNNTADDKHTLHQHVYSRYYALYSFTHDIR